MGTRSVTYENCAQSKSAFTKSKICSREGVSRSRAIRCWSKASGFSLMYFSSEKKNKSEASGMVLPWPKSSSICECKIVATALMIDSTFGFEMVVLMNKEFVEDDFLFSFSSWVAGSKIYSSAALALSCFVSTINLKIIYNLTV